MSLVPEDSKRQAPAQKDSKIRGIYWPAQLLPEAVDNVRVSTWGYDADIDDFWSSASQNTVSQHATNLLSDIADMMEASQPVLPILFVVHILGGVVVKAVSSVMYNLPYGMTNYVEGNEPIIGDQRDSSESCDN
jgi:hypothetical protein